MIIIGVDFHPEFQQIALVDKAPESSRDAHDALTGPCLRKMSTGRSNRMPNTEHARSANSSSPSCPRPAYFFDGTEL